MQPPTSDLCRNQAGLLAHSSNARITFPKRYFSGFDTGSLHTVAGTAAVKQPCIKPDGTGVSAFPINPSGTSIRTGIVMPFGAKHYQEFFGFRLGPWLFPESVTPSRRSAQAIDSSLLAKNRGEPMGAPAIFEKQIEPESTLESRIQVFHWLEF
jgi:hypothetical protein